MSGGSPLKMRSILNNDDNPAFAVRRTTESLSKPNYENRYGKPDYPVAESGWPSHVQQPTTSLLTPEVRELPTETRKAPPQLYPAYSQADALPHLQSRPSSLQGNNGPRISTTASSSPSSYYATSSEMARMSKKNKYPCPYAATHSCTATFTTSGHAARHGKKHTGEKSVHCPICNKAFTRKDNMKQHRRTHKNNDPEQLSPRTQLQNSLDQSRRENSQPDSDGDDVSSGSSPRE
ncbi:hypothetical protein BGW36DRAFT_36295 [Talaromyces proteolyticus]|uniref:C2H2 type master regulator of conidiophore development brlA n=1 Tax=Talaromyces proteolyticus TaxID=1131652 RepID=A0AAD4PXW2_9EURO|nr:uncharacterized protein BGW36DRAFT_36295 [Talaromyces proteolyticus]KAH8693198.1 hypothetical protein BGW36DRAFT_36295 [Talaromyces proteolyticus]